MQVKKKINFNYFIMNFRFMKKIVLDILIFRKFICDAKILFFYTKNLNF